MSNLPSARLHTERSDGSPDEVPEHRSTHATTVVRAESETRNAETESLHPLLQEQLKELRLRTGSAAVDVRMLLRIVSSHYHSIDDERRGIVRSMQLMADEARALAQLPLEARDGESDQLQAILDHIKETVLTADEHGAVRSFNPTGERVFGYDQDEVVGHSLDLLIPQIAYRGGAAQGLAHLAAATGDTQLDLAPR